MVVVPMLTDLRNVPALSKRGAPPPKEIGAAFCALNNAPARLVITAAFKLMFAAPVQTVVPALSKVRVVIVRKDGLAMVSVAPGEITVRPVPLIAPPVQVIKPPAVTTLLPPREPLLNVKVEGATVPVPSKLAVPPEITMVLLVQ